MKKGKVNKYQSGGGSKLTQQELDLYNKYKAYVGSDTYRSRLQNFRTPEQAQEEQYTSLDRLKRAQPPVISPINLPKQIQGWYEMPAMLDGIGSIILSPKRSKYAFTHEMDHLNRAGGNRYNNSELATLKLMNKEGSNIPKDQLDYLQDPTESGARLSNIRAGAVEYGIHKDFGEEFTKEQLQELIEKTKGEKVFEFIQAYNPEELLQALNTIADSGEQQEINIARNGGEIQESTMKKKTLIPKGTNKYQQGGIPDINQILGGFGTQFTDFMSQDPIFQNANKPPEILSEKEWRKQNGYKNFYLFGNKDQEAFRAYQEYVAQQQGMAKQGQEQFKQALPFGQAMFAFNQLNEMGDLQRGLGAKRDAYTLDDEVPQQAFKGYFKEGGIPERYREMGFSRVGQKKNSTRDGKKWMVLAKKGDKYKVVHGGAEGMSDYTKHKDKDRRARFWKRHNAGSPGKSRDPFSPLFWHKKFGTW